jgi:spore maturation protein CgeB
METTSFVKFILKNFDCILLSVTALSYRGVIKLTKHYFPMILWDIDSPYIPYLIYSQYINEDRHVLLCYSKGGCDLWRRYGVNSVFFPLACDTTLFYPTKSQTKNIPILFTGRYLGDRLEGYEKFLYPLVHRFGKKVVIVGSGWESNQIVKNARVINGLPYWLLNTLYNMARICINIHRDNSRRTHTALNLRTFEIMGSGQICITDRVSGIEELFQPDDEIIVCDDANEMLANVEKILNDDPLRAKIARAGYNKILQAHTIKHRAIQLIKILEKHGYLSVD